MFETPGPDLSPCWVGRGGGDSWIVLSVVMAEGERPVPSRTRKLSPPAPMVLHSPGCGRVGRRRHQTQGNGPGLRSGTIPFFVRSEPGRRVRRRADLRTVRAIVWSSSAIVGRVRREAGVARVWSNLRSNSADADEVRVRQGVAFEFDLTLVSHPFWAISCRTGRGAALLHGRLLRQAHGRVRRGRLVQRRVSGPAGRVPQ